MEITNSVLEEIPRTDPKPATQTTSKPVPKDAFLNRYARRIYSIGQRVLVDERENTVDVQANIDTLTDSGAAKSERLAAALRVVSNYAPEVVTNILRKPFNYKSDKLPFDKDCFQFKKKIGFGGVNFVFLLESLKKEFPSYVLKINKPSLEVKDNKQLLEIAKSQKKEFETIRDVYREIPDLIPEEYYILTQGPIKNWGAVMVLQPYFGENIRDIFDDIEKEELQYMLESNSDFRKQLEKFVRITKENPQLFDNELDLLGKNNLAVVGEKGKERLLFLDPHFRSVESRGQESKVEIRNNFNYLSGLVEATDQ